MTNEQGRALSRGERIARAQRITEEVLKDPQFSDADITVQFAEAKRRIEEED